jgi:hypothetical protein
MHPKPRSAPSHQRQTENSQFFEVSTWPNSTKLLSSPQNAAIEKPRSQMAPHFNSDVNAYQLP